MTPRQCEIAAEAFTASLFAQAGFDVLVQYGAHQPHYDLVAVKGQKTLKISVKGSQTGGWMLAVKFIKPGVSYHAAIDLWLCQQKSDVLFCFVQYWDVKFGSAPRVYIARPEDVATHMKSQRSGKGHGALREDVQLRRPGSKCSDRIPPAWRFSEQRVASF